MARKEDRKKQKKRLREKKREARQQQHLASLRPSIYPAIVINADCEDSTFREVVGEIASGFSYDDDAHCPPELRDHYCAIAMVGWQQWYAALKAKTYSEHDFHMTAERALQEATVPVFLHFGTWLFQRLPAQYTARFTREYFFRLDQYRNVLLVSFTLMESVEDKGQRLYIPHWNPTVKMQGVEWQVGLYPHALDRLCSRLVPQGALTYSGYIDVYSRFSQDLLRFSPVALFDGQEAARVEFRPPLGSVFYGPYAEWVREVLDLPATHEFAGDGFWSIVLGYLPLHIQGKYARAKTFLLPGFTKTPEYGIGLRKAGSASHVHLMKAMTNEDARTFDLTGDTIAAIKWYHANGVPQIFRADK